MKRFFLYAAILFTSGIFSANIYNSIVDATNWCNNIPQSIDALRAYYEVSSPRSFYPMFAPITILLVLLSLILFWKRSKKVRMYLGLAFFILVSADILTFLYFYPRNTILFSADTHLQLENITTACQQWQHMNWIRSGMVLFSVLFQFMALDHMAFKRE